MLFVIAVFPARGHSLLVQKVGDILHILFTTEYFLACIHPDNNHPVTAWIKCIKAVKSVVTSIASDLS